MALSSSWTNSSPTLSKCNQKKAGHRKLPTLRVSVVGGADAGKADILHAYTDGRYPLSERPARQRTVCVASFGDATLHLRDLPADDLARAPSRSGSRRGTVEAVLAVYSVEDQATLEEAVGVVSELLKDPTHPASRAVLMGTWRGTRPRSRQVTYKQAKDRADALGVGFIEYGCSAHNAGRVRDTVNNLADQCLKDWEEGRAVLVPHKEPVHPSLMDCLQKIASVIRTRLVTVQ